MNKSTVKNMTTEELLKHADRSEPVIAALCEKLENNIELYEIGADDRGRVQELYEEKYEECVKLMEERDAAKLGRTEIEAELVTVERKGRDLLKVNEALRRQGDELILSRNEALHAIGIKDRHIENLKKEVERLRKEVKMLATDAMEGRDKETDLEKDGVYRLEAENEKLRDDLGSAEEKIAELLGTVTALTTKNTRVLEQNTRYRNAFTGISKVIIDLEKDEIAY